MSRDIETPSPRIVCAWCHPGPPPDGEVVSHGICPRHAAEQMAELKRKTR